MRTKMLLSQALHEGRISHADLFCASMRRFGAFRLLDITHIKSRKTDEDDDDDGMWFECVYPKKEPEFRLKIRWVPSFGILQSKRFRFSLFPKWLYKKSCHALRFARPVFTFLVLKFRQVTS